LFYFHPFVEGFTINYLFNNVPIEYLHSHTYTKKAWYFFSIPLTEVFGVTRKEQNKSKVHAKKREHFNLVPFFASNRQTLGKKEKTKMLFPIF
jgi:hypothetical protein